MKNVRDLGMKHHQIKGAGSEKHRSGGVQESEKWRVFFRKPYFKEWQVLEHQDQDDFSFYFLVWAICHLV